MTSQRPLVLSLFPGVDLLGRAFCAEGFSVVTGPDLITGGDVRDYVGAPGRFNGLIGGSPCQDFSRKRRAPPTGNGVAMIREFLRVVSECRPAWFLLENVDKVPDVRLDGYEVQRIPISHAECGGRQNRLRHMQFGHRHGWIIRPELQLSHAKLEPAVLCRDDRSYPEICRLQDLPGPLDLPGMCLSAKKRAIANGVPILMGRVLARAVLAASARDPAADCICGCGQRVTDLARHADASCRKRMERRRRTPREVVTL